jgi:hypothetical protein
MDNQKRFRQYLRGKGFRVSPNLAQLSLMPHFYKDKEGNHVLLSGIGISLSTGVNTKDDDLGCVCFFYAGTKRRKYCRRIESAEMLKCTTVYRSAVDAMVAFAQWRKQSEQILTDWIMIQ